MQNNLEEISFEEVKGTNGQLYSDFRKGLSPHYFKAYFDIFKGYFFIFLASFLIFYFGDTINNFFGIIIPIGSLLIGYSAAYLALFIHEAGHFNLHPDKKINDNLSLILLCLLFGISLKSYRKIHWQHHIHLGTPDDTEISYFNGITKLFLLETLTGIHLLKTIIRKDTVSVLTNEQVKNTKMMLIVGIVIHVSIILVSLLLSNWVFAICWVLGFGVFFPFFATIRQILEHRDEIANSKIDFFKIKHGKLSRIFYHTFLSSSFGAAGFTRHMIHHWDPYISYTRLKDIEQFLIQHKETREIITKSRTTYLNTFKKIVSAS